MSEATCEWVDEGRCYATSCLESFVVNEDSADEHEWIKFCCFCGKPVHFEVPHD